LRRILDAHDLAALLRELELGERRLGGGLAAPRLVQIQLVRVGDAGALRREALAPADHLRRIERPALRTLARALEIGATALDPGVDRVHGDRENPRELAAVHRLSLEPVRHACVTCWYYRGSRTLTLEKARARASPAAFEGWEGPENFS